jgi:hypothetical protein
VEKQFTEVGSRIWCSRAHGAGAHTVTVHVKVHSTRVRARFKPVRVLSHPTTSKVKKDEAVQPPTIAIIARFDRVVLNRLLRSIYTT